ncbi:MAG: hypothetical protein HC917_07765 [Richelia sp. SM2_1_7]|nr:hypothetical protein [Richelia sp. SM2_1_7]
MQRLRIFAVAILDAGVVCCVRDVGRRSIATSLHYWRVFDYVYGFLGC